MVEIRDAMGELLHNEPPLRASPDQVIASARGRRAKRRSVATRVSVVSATAVVAAIVVAPTMLQERRNDPKEGLPVAASSVPASPDQRVFADVVAGAFPMPGATQRRTILFRRAAQSIANVSCGGSAFSNLDSTAERFDQAWYADLDLIAEKGLVEQRSFAEGEEQVELGDCVESLLPSFPEWLSLSAPWADVTRAAVESPRVTAVHAEVASCARTRFGLSVDASDPVESLLNDGRLMGLDEASSQSEMRRMSDEFVACTGGYFKALEAELAPQRDLMVERNRALLERFAVEMSSAGYAP